MRLDQLLKQAPIDRLDAQLLLAHVLQKDRAWLYAHGEYQLSAAQYQIWSELVQKRQAGQPLAYLIGEQEFWGLKLKVNAATLIPRPETETLVAWVLDQYPAEPPLKLLDLGTGSGAIAIAIAYERPAWCIHASDLSKPALQIAQQNAQAHGLKIHWWHSHWFDQIHERYDLILSNPPYIAEQDSHLQNLRFEPQSALVAGPQGLDAIAHIVRQAPAHLNQNGVLLIEHGYDQGAAVRHLFEQNHFQRVQTLKDLAGHERITLGYRQSADDTPRPSVHLEKKSPNDAKA